MLLGAHRAGAVRIVQVRPPRARVLDLFVRLFLLLLYCVCVCEKRASIVLDRQALGRFNPLRRGSPSTCGQERAENRTCLKPQFFRRVFCFLLLLAAGGVFRQADWPSSCASRRCIYGVPPPLLTVARAFPTRFVRCE